MTKKQKNGKQPVRLITTISLIILFIGLSGAIVNAQVSSVDSLEIEKLLEQSHGDLIKFKYDNAIKIAVIANDKSAELGYRDGVLNSSMILAEAYKYKADFPKALNYYLQVLSEFERINNPKELRYINIQLGELFYDWGVPEKALVYFENARKVLVNNSEENKISLLNRIAKTYIRLNQYQEALSTFQEVLVLQKKSQSEETINTLKSIASIYGQLNAYEKALVYNFEILEINKQQKDLVSTAVVLNTIGSMYKNLSDLPKSLEYYNAALEVNRQINNDGSNDNGIVSNLLNIGIINQSLGNYRSSIKNFNDALEIKKKRGTSVEIAVMNNYLASIHYSLSNYTDSKAHTLKAIELLENTSNKRLLATNQKRLADIFEKLGDYRNALESYEQYSILKDSILYHDQLRKEREKYKQYVIGSTEKESKLDIIDQELRELELKNEKTETEREKQEIQLQLRAKELQNASLKNSQLEGERELQLMRLQKEQLETQRQNQEIVLLEQKQDLQTAEIQKNELVEKERLKEIELQKTNLALQKSALEIGDTRQTYLVWTSLSFFIIFLLILIGYLVKQQDNKVLTSKNVEITEQKDTIEEINQELIELNEEKNDLIGIVAHDLKSPLNQIMGFLNIIKITSKEQSAEQQEYIANIDQSVQGLKNMVNKILDVNAIESQTENINLEKVHIEEILHETLIGFEPLAEKKNIVLKKELDKNVSKLELDGSFVKKVFTNLLSNAIKYSPLGQTVTIKLHENGKRVRTEFIDNGQGISANDMQKLFGKYHKLSARPTAGEDSTGLGLSIVKKYVEVMGGKVWCESVEGKGSNFIVEFEIG
jgi:signal transduction histidine kinase